MNYKSVLEEQIRELQKQQDKLSNRDGLSSQACEVALTIKDLVQEAKITEE